MKYQIKEKAYEIDFSKIEEGYLYDSDSFIVYAETRNKAKTKLMEKAYCESIYLAGDSEEVTYLNIPVIRCKIADKLDFEGESKTIRQIEIIQEERKRNSKLDEILNNVHIKYCYIIKRGYYKPNYAGYTDFKHRAGVYTKEEAVSHAKSCSDIRLERIDIEEHNKMIQAEVQDLNTRILA